MLKTLTDKVLRGVRGEDAALHKAFIRHFVDGVSEQDSGHFDEDVFRHMIDSHWTMARTRKAKASIVQVADVPLKNSHRRKTVIDIVSDDIAFVVDSVAATLNKHKCLIELLVHPVMPVVHDDRGNFHGIETLSGKDEVSQQSHIHIHVRETLSPQAVKALTADLYATIQDVCAANADWKTMLVRLKEASANLEISKTERPQEVVYEYCSFLDYLHNNNFTLLGYAEYIFDGRGQFNKTSGLGLLSDEADACGVDEVHEGFPLGVQAVKAGVLPPLMIAKTKATSSVHRRVPMDVVALKLYDDKGAVIGEKLFLGLFTSVTYSRSVNDVPFLRWKVRRIMEMSDYGIGTHDYKAMRHILEKYPRDELFQTPTESLLQTCSKILRLQERQHIALFPREDIFGGYISCLVYVPRDRFGTSLRKRIVKLLECELGGTCGSFFTSMDDSLFARGLFRIDVDADTFQDYDYVLIEEKLQELGRTWAERISYAMEAGDYPEDQLMRLAHDYGEAFPVNYMNSHSAKSALFDIQKVEKALEDDGLQLDLYHLDSLAPHEMRLKIYNPFKPIVLSDIMPILENMGLRAISELPYEISPASHARSVWIHDFLLERPTEEPPVDLANVKAYFEEAFLRIWRREMDSDKLNRLVLSAELSWRDVVILRSYVKYLRQARLSYSQNYVYETLTKNYDTSRHLVALFKARLHPDHQDKADKVAPRVEKSIFEQLKTVESLNQDRVLRKLVSVILATLRTNFYQTLDGDDGTVFKDYVSLKFDSKALDFLPNPKPFREIFVYSTQVEGIHLRGDKIARGGLRWSDRHEDFRTEILGLMKAQMVKNSVIVPMGSKGGFVVKTKTQGRDEFREAGVACYKTFIRGLLDITDNLDGDRVIPPEQTVRRDGDDPYLVVAADKGTATFSDIANGLSQAYGFWLDDAFASGGSAGYDHKKMGITARGAWESVKLHFRQLGHNTQAEPFDVIGVGDMGGDVFGNGMLLSPHIRLIGAFNHLHIFCDPAPDIEAAYNERKRLFKEVGGWAAYNQDVLSKGGRIYARSDKSLKLTAQIRERFGIEEKEVAPEVLIQAMLRAQTDLLWFGGIGTYIKSSRETHADAGDKANDGLRINASELKAYVIGEGANLGVTQLGRIEFSRHGGKVNSDFIDNSAGVDSSDHEVNIKILLSAVMKAPGASMNLDKRNALLGTMTKTVEDHVLRHNYQQALAVSFVEARAEDNLQRHDEFIQDLEREEGLDRAIEFLPDAEEIQRLLVEKRGLTRPELSVLVSYAKISLTKALLKSGLPDEDGMQSWLVDYFPVQLRKPYAPFIHTHKLRREIIAMAIANSLINRLGPTFIQATMKKTGMDCGCIVRAYIAAREIFGLRDMWNAIEALDNKVPSSIQLDAMLDIAQLLEFVITWLLTRRREDLDVPANVEMYGEPLDVLYKSLPSLLSDDLKAAMDEKVEAYTGAGFPVGLAKRVAASPVLKSALDVTSVAEETGADLEKVARVYFAIGHRFRLDWLLGQAAELPVRTSWDREAIDAIVDKLYRCQAGLTATVLRGCAFDACEPGTELQVWLAANADSFAQIDPFFKSLRRAGEIDLAMLMVSEQRLRHLYGG